VKLRLNNKIMTTCETEQNKNNSHIAEWLMSVSITRYWFESSAIYIFCSVLYVALPLNFVKIFLACGQRYPLEISTGTGVTDHAESEYAIFIHRQHTVQNHSGVI
jgi:hypothetical protein